MTQSQVVSLYQESSVSAAGISKTGIVVQRLSRLKRIAVEVDATITAGTIGTFRLGGILNALLSSFSLTSSKYGNLVTNAKGSDLAFIKTYRPNGKNAYAKFGTSAATAAIVNHTTNYNPTAWVNLTSYYLEAHFEYSLEKYLESQPDNLFYIDTQKDSLTIDIACADKLGTAFLTSLGAAALTACNVQVFGFYTDEPDYNSQVKVYANLSNGQNVSYGFYEWPAVKASILASGLGIVKEQTMGPHPDYPIGRVRTVKQKSASNAASGSATITAVEDKTPRIYEAEIITAQNNATPFAPATGTTVTEIHAKITDDGEGGMGGQEISLVKKKGEYVQHDAFGETDEIDMAGVFPIMFTGSQYGSKKGYDAKNVSKFVVDQTTTAAIDFGSILVASIAADR